MCGSGQAKVVLEYTCNFPLCVEKLVNVIAIYLAEARKGELSVHLLVDIIDLQGKLPKINIEVTQCMRYR